MLVFKYTVKWRVRGWFFRRFHDVATLVNCGDHYVATKHNGAKAYFPAYDAEVIVGRGVTFTAITATDTAPRPNDH